MINPLEYPEEKINILDENWNIYVDETYISHDDRDNNKFVTGFYALNANQEPQVLSIFKNKLYQKSSKNEIKSTMISDNLNRELLMGSNFDSSIYLINQRKYIDYKDDKLLNIAFLIKDYIFPIKYILQEIKEKTDESLVDINVNVLLDERTEFTSSNYNFNNIANKFLKQIEREESNLEIHFHINLDIVDSKTSLGVQIADMLCGAYSKQVRYIEFENDISLIPFNFIFKSFNTENVFDKEIMQLYGELTIIHKLLSGKIPKAFEGTSEYTVFTKMKTELYPESDSSKPYSTHNSVIDNQDIKAPVKDKIIIFINRLEKAYGLADKSECKKILIYLNGHFKPIKAHLSKLAKKHSLSIKVSNNTNSKTALKNYIDVLHFLSLELSSLKEGFRNQIKELFTSINTDLP